MATAEHALENDRDRLEVAVVDDHGHQRIADLERTTITTTDNLEVPGIGAAAAYAAEDAVGTRFNIPVPLQGNILAAQVIDTDDNAIDMSILLFNDVFTVVADNAAFTLDADDFNSLVGIIVVNSFVALSGDTVGQENNINLPYEAPNGVLHCQIVTTGVPNFTAGTGLFVSLTIESKEVMFVS